MKIFNRAEKLNIWIYIIVSFGVGSLGLYLLQELSYILSNRVILSLIGILTSPGRTIMYTMIQQSGTGIEHGIILFQISLLNGVFYLTILLGIWYIDKTTISILLIALPVIFVLLIGFAYPKQYVEKIGFNTQIYANRTERRCLGYSMVQSDNVASDGSKISICKGLIY